ncbi:MAG: CinA family nicotinamide mononucleotide deamidase-related protein [Gammaproteobacteria bacterium]|jgi:nicotinamide-nucleotide amidase|nr:CinA family nicotinamide mononucleotide deamidase-related protein [Gammaproteobacteria bacterium]
MKIELICTGEEVLSGQIIDTNAAWFGDVLMNVGLELQRKTTVGDRMEDLVSVFQERSLHADVILVNGGLGPTSDDLSAAAAAKALNVELVEDSGWRAHLESWYSKRDRKMPVSNYKQCLLPEGAVLVDNPMGSAPGFRVKINNAWLFFTPGVPVELKPMVMDQFLPFITEEFGITDAIRLEKLVTIGHGESTLADELSAITIPEGITLGYRPSPPHVEIKIFARGNLAISAMPNYIKDVKKSLDTALVTDRFPSISEEVHTLMMESGKSLSIAESCTGGMLTSQLVDFPGSSTYLKQGLVTYSNTAKQKILGVKEDTLQNHGAVSLEAALEMAMGARSLLETDFALATTGIAGPDGGSDEKPVGLVAIALCDNNTSWVQTIKLSNRSRNLVRVMSCAVAHDMLRRRLIDEDPIVDYPFISRLDSQVIHVD